LDWVEKLGVPHVSVYMLEVDEDSRLGREILGSGVRYGAADVPADDDIADFYEMAAERLARMGIERYEISNFARSGFESRHNLKYWRREPYLGFGADAHSFDGAVRWQNPESAAKYVAGFPAPERVLADPKAERFFLGLRLREGVPSGEFPEVIDRFEREGLLERSGGRVRLTSRGVLLSNEVFAEFVT
jgi:oxygen-independent coproporphyrinogen-3 oxidase